MPRNATPTNPYKRARQAAGLSQERVLILLSRRLPDSALPSLAKLSRLETEGASAKADFLLVMNLADLYGVGIGALDPELADWLDTIKEQVKQSSLCITAGDDLTPRLFDLAAWN